MQDLRFIKDIYALSEPLDMVEEVHHGVLSNNYILTDGTKKYFLKKYRFGEEEKIREIHATKKYFADGGVPVVEPIKNSAGGTYFERDGFYALFPFVDGVQYKRNQVPERALESLAETLAHMHYVGKDSKLVVSKVFTMWNTGEFAEKAQRILVIIGAKDKKSEFDMLALETIWLKMALVDKNVTFYDSVSLDDTFLTHGDFHADNVFFDEAGKVMKVFDFENACMQSRMYELFRSMDYTCLNGVFDIQNIHRARAYVHTYLAHYGTDREELSRGLRVWYLKVIHSLWIEQAHFIDNNTRPDIFLQNQFNTVKYLAFHYDDFEKQLLAA